MKRNRINLPLPTGGANTQDATALGGASREQNVLLLDTKGRPGCAVHLSRLEGCSLQASGKCPAHKAADGGELSQGSIEGANRAHL